MDSKAAVLMDVNAVMAEINKSYAYDAFNGTPTYPYFIGSYREVGRSPSAGRVDGLMTITGWDKADSIARLLTAEEAVKAAFNGRLKAVEHLTVTFDQAGGYELPVDAAKLKRVVINIATRVYGE